MQWSDEVMKIKTVYFGTGNEHKFAEVKDILKEYPLRIEQIDAKGKEIQSDSIEEIARESATRAAIATKSPLFVEDTGFYVRNLNSFPGPYAAYVNNTIGLRGILILMRGVKDREAIFRSAVAFAAPGIATTSFTGELKGKITSLPKGSGGFGYDPIFEPYEGNGKTLGEMSISEKSLISHRAIAVRKFGQWYVSEKLG
jgi:XTP/dITP diphosphohydrolase